MTKPFNQLPDFMNKTNVSLYIWQVLHIIPLSVLTYKICCSAIIALPHYLYVTIKFQNFPLIWAVPPSKEHCLLGCMVFFAGRMWGFAKDG